MKLKITVLSAIVLSAILLVLDGWIYSTLSERLIQFTEANINNKAKLIAQDYADYISEERMPGRELHLDTWLNQYSQAGQSIVMINLSNQVMAYRGKLPLNEVKKNFDIPTTSTIKRLEIHKNPIMWGSFPITKSGHLLGYVILLEDMSNLTKFMDSLLTILITGSIGAIFLSTLGGYLISSTAVRPINQMIKLVERIQADRLDERLTVSKGQDEVSRLALTFNHMLDRIERSFAQQNRFVADASHEIRTPLTTIQGYANLLSRWGKNDPEVLDRAIQVIQTESVRLHDLANNLLTLASLEADTHQLHEDARVDEIIREMVEAVSPLHPHLSFSYELHAQSTVAVTPNHLKQMVLNVLDNAIKYTSTGEKIQIHTYTKHSNTVIEIIDSGKGIPAEDLPYVTERFYRVDKSRGRKQGGGTGLGLAIVSELIHAYGGSFTIESEVAKGTKVTITLPTK